MLGGAGEDGLPRLGPRLRHHKPAQGVGAVAGQDEEGSGRKPAGSHRRVWRRGETTFEATQCAGSAPQQRGFLDEFGSWQWLVVGRHRVEETDLWPVEPPSFGKLNSMLPVASGTVATTNDEGELDAFATPEAIEARVGTGGCEGGESDDMGEFD